MGRKNRIMQSKKDLAKQIAAERIKKLLSLAKEADEKKLRDRYVSLALEIKEKYRVKLPREMKENYCKKCRRYLKPGENCRIRTRNGIRVITCLECKNIRRVRYK